MKMQIRIRTRGVFTDVSETRPDEDGFSMSWKMYGPFATADEQRAFMRRLYEVMPVVAEAERARAIADVDAWVRFDEEADYEPPTPEPPAEPTSALVIANADEVRKYSSSDVRDENGVIAVDIRTMIDGLRRVVW